MTRAPLLAGLLTLAACSSDNSTCVSGMSTSCACTDGRTGAQVCLADGTFGECVCTTPATDAGPAETADAGTLTDAGPPAPRRLFVTSLSYRPTAVEDVCQNAADAQGLGGTWVAWLSRRFPSPTPDADAIDEITAEGPWMLLTGEMAFRNRAQLATVPSVPIDVDETGTRLTDSFAVWTGTLRGGATGDHDCQRWTENDGLFGAVFGSTSSTDEWTDAGVRGCDLEARLYCFEQ